MTLVHILASHRQLAMVPLVVVSEAYVSGVSTRRVEEFVTALGVSGRSKSEVSHGFHRRPAARGRGPTGAQDCR